MADVKKYASINDLDEAVDCILSAKSIIGPFKGLSEISTQTQNALDSLNDAWNYVENMKEGLGDYTASTKKSTPSIHDMIAQTRANNNSLVKSRVELTKKDNFIDKNWSNYRRLSEMKDDGTIMEIIMCMNGISSGEGNKFEKLVDGCLSVPLAVFLKIKETYTPRTLPLLPSREYRITATYRDGPAYVVQFGCDGSELSSMVRFTISDSGTVILTCIWDTISHGKIGELRNQVSISSIDEIENIFIIADEMLDEIYSELE